MIKLALKKLIIYFFMKLIFNKYIYKTLKKYLFIYICKKLLYIYKVIKSGFPSIAFDEIVI